MTRQLRQKGLHPEVIAEQMDHCYPVSDERPAAVEVARRHASRYRRHDPDTARRRLYAVLARRGFSPSDCRAALEIAGSDSTRDSG